MRGLAWVCGLGVALGCNAHPLKSQQLQRSATWTTTICAGDRAKVDILFVVDGSPSMAEEAFSLARQMSFISDVYDQPRGGVDYRIAVVDSQVAQPGCAVEDDAGGRFIDTSCRQRIGDFVSGPNAESYNADRRQAGCLEHCGLETLDTEPSEVLGDPIARPRPWIESTYGLTNLPPGTSVAEDLTCRAPTGITGCTFEAPLEAMRLALRRTEDPDDPAFGFLRPDAGLFVLFITDEPDCSFGPDLDAVTQLFDPTGPRTYWSDPDADAPTSGMCWNAGVACDGDPDDLTCVAADRPVPGGTAPVLRPVGAYIDQLRAIEAQRLEALPDLERAVFVSVVGGVDRSRVEARYRAAADALELARAGTGLGCESPTGRAYPPVRLAEVAAEFNDFARWDESNLFSVCEDDWVGSLACVPGWDPFDLRQLCINPCFADTDPTTETLEPACVVDWVDPDGVLHPLPPCEVEAGWYRIPDGAIGCGNLAEADETYPDCTQRLGRELIVQLDEGVMRGCFNVTCETAPERDVCELRRRALWSDAINW